MILIAANNVVEAIKAVCQNLVDDIAQFGNGFNQIYAFLVDLIQDILNVTKYILDAFRLISSAINLLPDFLKFMAVILIGVYVAFQVLGRESGAKR